MLILIVDVAYVAWGAMAAISPDHLLRGPGGKGILPAAYEGYSHGSWSQLVETSPLTAGWIVNAIGPFELTEYLGLGLIYVALALTAPFAATRRPVPSTA